MENHGLRLYRARRLRRLQIRKWTWGLFFDLILLAGLITAGECLGRLVTADWQGFLVFAVAAIAWTPFFFGRETSPIAKGLKKAWTVCSRRVVNRFRYDFGFDFRPGKKEPRFRDLDLGVFLVLLPAVGACALSRVLLPLLSCLPDVSGFLYLLVLGGFWALLLATLAANAVGAVAYFKAMRTQDSFHRNPASPGPRRRFPSKLGLLLLFSVAVGLGLEVAFGATGVFLALAACTLLHFGLGFLPRRGAAPTLLIHRLEEENTRRAGLFSLEHIVLAMAFAWVLTLLVAACGTRAVPPAIALPLSLDPGGPSTDITGFIGRTMAFVSFLFLLPVTLRSLGVNLAWLLRDPARPRRKVLAHPPRSLEAPGPGPWRFLSRPSAPPASRADLDYDPEGKRGKPGSAPPLKRRLDGLGEKDRLFLLDHFDFITKRRVFYRGLSRVLKTASGHSFTSGGGFLLAPHFFFIEGLHRDDPGGEEGESRIIGAPFRALWNLRTRQFLHEMLTSLSIDIIFFEDGVKWPHLKRVFDQAFERYMRNPGGGPIQEADFRLLQGVRIFIEDLEPDRSAKKREGYREPHFANLSRARVLMVFRDRGGEKDPAKHAAPRVQVPAPLFG